MAKQHHSESGRSKAARRQHDKRAKAYESHTEQAWHQSPTVRIVMVVLVVVAIAGLTGMFVAGLIKW